MPRNHFFVLNFRLRVFLSHYNKSHMLSSSRILEGILCSSLLSYGRANYQFYFRSFMWQSWCSKQQCCCSSEWGGSRASGSAGRAGGRLQVKVSGKSKKQNFYSCDVFDEKEKYQKIKIRKQKKIWKGDCFEAIFISHEMPDTATSSSRIQSLPGKRILWRTISAIMQPTAQISTTYAQHQRREKRITQNNEIK